MNVILSAPHAYCTTRDPVARMCDTLAEPFTRAIGRELQKRNITVHSFINHELPRAIVDMNRKQGRKYEFRKDLDKHIEEMPSNDIVLDVHSAPPETIGRPFEMYLLDMENFTEDNAFNDELFDFLVDHHVKAFHLYGTNDNDIIIRSILDFGMKNVSLVEINESIDEQRMDEIASFIADYIVHKNI